MPTCEKCGTSFSEQHHLDKASNLCPNCYKGISHAEGLKLVQTNINEDSDKKWYKKKSPFWCVAIMFIIVCIIGYLVAGNFFEFWNWLT